MAKRKAGTKTATQTTDGQNGGIVALTKELFQAAITLRGSVEPAHYKLKVVWTEPHRDQVRAEIRAAMKRVLLKRGVREADFELFIARFMQQAEAQYAEWPLVA